MASLECKIITQKNFDDDNIILEVDSQSVAYISLNRLDKHNALTNTMIIGMTKALDFLAEHSPQIRVLVLKSIGPTFCAGADLKAMQRMVKYNYQENYQDAYELGVLLDKLYNYFCPTIAMVQGNAYGGGVGIICCCDFAIANVQAEFCLTEVKLGLIPAVISPYIVETIGIKYARRCILAAEKFNAIEALRLGMLSDLAETSENNILLIGLLNKTINKLLTNGPIAMQKAKILLNDLYSKNNDIISKTAQAIANVRVSTEGQEGLLSFIDKRQPNWINQ